MSKAFTLIEVLVVVSIIVLMTALTLPNYRAGDNQLALQRSVHKMAQSLRMAQEYAISAKEFNGTMPKGYGVYFNLNQPASYIVFADLAPFDQAYSGVNEKVEEVNLETNVVLSNLAPATPESSLTIVFIPPDPSIVFSPDASSATVTIQAKGTETTVSQYTYFSDPWPYWSWPPPRASCDLSTSAFDCPDSFSSSQSDPYSVYDWSQTCFGQWWCLDISKGFTKKESQTVLLQQKSVGVNKAGLIAVE